MLEACDLACVRGDETLFEGLSFSVGPGEALWIEGENGSGKTSLLRMLCGVGHPDAGEMRWCGSPLPAGRDALLQDLAYVGHVNALKDDLSVLENLEFHARISGLDHARDRMLAALDAVGLGGRAELPARVLSQGQRRRAALARLWLAVSRRLWILDEPFAALDAASVARLADLIDAQVGGGGIVVLTTHQEVDLPHGRTRRLRLGCP
jgi:heme exporter protein A